MAKEIFSENLSHILGIYELRFEFPNDLRLRILPNNEIPEKCLNLM